MNAKNLVIAIIGILLVAIVGLLLFSPPQSGPITEIDSNGVRAAAKRGATIIDIRTAGEYQAGHLAGAVNIEDSAIAQALEGADKEAEYVIYCATGSRSRPIVNWMESKGFTNIKHFTAGISSWDGEIVGGLEPGDITSLYDESTDATDGQTPDSSGKDQALKDPLIAPTDLPVLVEFSTDT